MGEQQPVSDPYKLAAGPDGNIGAGECHRMALTNKPSPPLELDMKPEQQTHPESESLLIAIAEVARLLNVSERHVLNMHKMELMPKSIRLGRSTRWNRKEIQQWLDAGCPNRQTWEASK